MNRTWIELDREALAHNIRRYQSLLPAGCRIMGVVKADAYGHGAVPVARRLEELGADYTEEEIRLVRIKFMCEQGN